MSYATSPAGPARARPASVTISSWLLFLFAATALISTILTLSVAGDILDVYEELFADVEGGGEAAASVAAVFVIGITVLFLLLALVLALLAVFNNRGKNGARITTWIIGGLFLCCGTLGLAGQAAGSMNFGGNTDPNMPTQEEINDRLAEVLPSWYNPASATLLAIGVIAVLVALILLALPPSNEFFRKRPPEWQPPVGGAPGGYTAYPAYPPSGYATPDPTPGPGDPPRGGESGFGPGPSGSSGPGEPSGGSSGWSDPGGSSGGSSGGSRDSGSSGSSSS